MSLIKLASLKEFFMKRPFSISAAAHAVRDIRNEERASSGKSKIINKIEEHLNHKNILHRSTARVFSNKIIDNDANINVDNVEKALRFGKNIHAISTKIDNSKFTLNTTVASTALGAGTGYSNSEDKKSGAVRGAIIGAGVGFGGSRALKTLANKTSILTKDMPLIHNEYFKNQDWHNRLTKANGKINKKIGNTINKHFLTKAKDK